MKRLPNPMLFAILIGLAFHSVALAAENDSARLAKDLKPLLSCLNGKQAAFSLSSQIDVMIDNRPQRVDSRLVRYDDQAFDLDLKHAEYSLQIRRRADSTAFALPHHKVVYIGRGEVDVADQLAPLDIVKRLTSPGSMVSIYGPMVVQAEPASAALLLVSLAKATYAPESQQWTVGKDVAFRFEKEGRAWDITADKHKLHGQIDEALPTQAATDVWPQGFKLVELPRREIERQLARGVRRALEVVAPSPLLTSPAQIAEKVEHGELRWIDGQRVALLSGTPEQIGKAHGELLADEASRCIDSVLYSFGTVQTIRTGRWFRQDLEGAYARLSPHIPEAHKRETRALAQALRIEPQLAEVLNVFPELFHCSGFAVFGSATKDGKLYHGRVLDYMTTIGLQDAATTFIVAVDGKIPFANVGYGGFIGSVSGMNAQKISLGEMGGRGEGLWDGAPMATLMRRALEECSTLDDVMSLWKNSPRTCEYYYVFADGKANRCVGVAATPTLLEFVLPGQSDPRIGEGIKDVVVLSAGDRLTKLRERVTEKYGQIDTDLAQWLMSRPVAMQSNLHNVLFVPQDGLLYVANADHKRPAAERLYVRFSLPELLDSMKLKTAAVEKPAANR